MRLSSMRYKNYTWPHNPETFVVEYRRQMAAHKVPFGGCVLQDLGVNCRILRGEGEFAGPGAYEEFKALAAVFQEPGAGMLPPLLSWNVRHTGTVPCDSWSVTAVYQPEMLTVLRMAAGFAAIENGMTQLRGIVDVYTVELGS